MELSVRFKKLDPRATAPVYATAAAAGADLHALSDTDIVIPPHATLPVRTGLAVEIPAGYVGLIFARSGLATKRGLAPANKVGVIDADYRGEILVALHNQSDVPQTVAPGERIAQMAILPYLHAVFCEADELSDTARGEGGFGSTGTK